MRAHLALAILLTTGCANIRERALRAEIAQIQQRVSAAETRVQTSTAEIGAQTKGLHTRVRYVPLHAWAARFNARPANERTIYFRQTRRNGYIFRRTWGCGPFGDGEAYAEINASASTRGDFLLRGITITPEASGLTVNIPLQIDIWSQVHGHLDPCIGGGVGWRPHVETHKGFAATFRLQFRPLQNDRLPYVLALVSPNSLEMPVRVDLGSLGSVTFGFRIDNFATELARGEMDLFFSRAGQIGPFPDGSMRTYSLQTVRPEFSADTASIRVGADVEVQVHP